MLKVTIKTRKPIDVAWHDTPLFLRLFLKDEYNNGRLKKVSMLYKNDSEMCSCFLWNTVEDYNNYRIKISTIDDYKSYILRCIEEGYCWSTKKELVDA